SRGRETGGSSNEVRPNAAADPAGDDLQVVGEVGRLEDHLQNRALLVTGVGELLQLGLDMLELARAEPADTDHGGDFPGASPQHVPNLVLLGGRRARSVWKSGDSADNHAAAFHRADGEIH